MRPVWKGAISFGLVHLPVALYPASQETEIDFDWLDKRSMDPVGYKRINKRTGREIQKEDIVKGIKQDEGDYVILSDEEIKAALPKSTQMIEIECFVKAGEIPFVFLERPYYLEPLEKSDKVYALLREAMVKADMIGIARVVMHRKEHLAALIPRGPALMLNTLRWAAEIRPMEELNLPPAGKSAASVKSDELKMATQLISSMADNWHPENYADNFGSAIHKLINQKIKAGKTETVTPLEELPAEGLSSNVIDLTKLLAQSLTQRKTSSTQAKAKSKNPKTSKPKATARRRA